MNKRPQVTSDSLFANNTVFPARIAASVGTRLQEHGCRTEVLSGQQAAAEVAALEEVDQVMASDRRSPATLYSLTTPFSRRGSPPASAPAPPRRRLLPVDSEHNAIFQSMPETIQQHLGYADLAQNGVC
jgi:1-deoxy-D-xylulose-5-phosphate reductoisomerase